MHEVNTESTLSRPQVSSSPLGIPRPANPSRYTAPVHIDVGGTIFTSSLETLTRYPDSRLSKLFNGTVPIVLDTLKQHYFIDRDGQLFRYILNFMRYGTLTIPDDFNELQALLEEARYFELLPMVCAIEVRLNRCKKTNLNNSFNWKQQNSNETFDVLMLNLSQDRILISGDIKLIHETFPEIQEKQQQQQTQTTLHAYIERDQFKRFTLNAFVNLTQVEIFQRLFNSDFQIEASTCGTSIDTMAQFSEYVFRRSNSTRFSSTLRKTNEKNNENGIDEDDDTLSFT